MEQVDSFDNEMLETLNKEFIKRVLEKILVRMKKDLSEEVRKELLN
jgi:hypothetical protein